MTLVRYQSRAGRRVQRLTGKSTNEQDMLFSVDVGRRGWLGCGRADSPRWLHPRFTGTVKVNLLRCGLPDGLYKPHFSLAFIFLTSLLSSSSTSRRPLPLLRLPAALLLPGQTFTATPRAAASGLNQSTMGDLYASLSITNLKALATQVLGSFCVSVEARHWGGHYAYYDLKFDPPSPMCGQFCIARVTKPIAWADESVEMAALDTIDYVSKYTSIPIPRVYYSNLDPEGGGVGGPVVLMACVLGHPLSHIWADLDIRQKKMVVDQLAKVVAQLANLQFGGLGSVRKDRSGFHVGPVSHRAVDNALQLLEEDLDEDQESLDLEHILNNTTFGPFIYAEEYIGMLLNINRAICQQELREGLDEIKKQFDEQNHLDMYHTDYKYGPPFGLLHPNLHNGTVFFAWWIPEDKKQRSQLVLTGVLAWELTRTYPRTCIYGFGGKAPFLKNDEERIFDEELTEEFINKLKQYSPTNEHSIDMAVEGSSFKKDPFSEIDSMWLNGSIGHTVESIEEIASLLRRRN